MKNRGFTMVELLGTITILGILMAITIVGYSRYQAQSKQKAFKLLMESSSNSAENYFMDNLHANDEVSLNTLVAEEYLESLIDPWDQNKKCTGFVTRSQKDENKNKGDAIDLYDYKVELKCSRGCKCIVYPNESNCECRTDLNE